MATHVRVARVARIFMPEEIAQCSQTWNSAILEATVRTQTRLTNSPVYSGMIYIVLEKG